jgi:hypothetical protein
VGHHLGYFWRVRDPLVFDNGVAVGGSSALVIRPDGSDEYSGHFQDSSDVDSYDVADACGLQYTGDPVAIATG